MFNPFPGLRSFQAEEDYLFFGREREIVDLVRRLRLHRFLAVLGSSGSGKSSLVRSGLHPALGNGLMSNAGSAWRIATLRPGNDPIARLAEALDQGNMLGVSGELAETNRVLIEATLLRGPRGLVDAVRQAHLPADHNLLLVVDQFEELFRGNDRAVSGEHSRDSNAAFVKLLLQAATQSELPIFIVITLRSDFIGSAMDYPGLPEAINAGSFLVPRMSREQLRLAITGPIAVGGATISQRLTLRLLNEFSEAQDELPILQHALMRTWDLWARTASPDSPLDLEHYEAIGTMKRALSMHAEEAFAENTVAERRSTETVFKALVDTSSDARGVRRPTRAADLSVGLPDLEAALAPFRRIDRSFLTPSLDTPLEPNSILDISHEALMRRWERLAAWAEEERLSATTYMRLAQAARWYTEGTAGLWRHPELQLGLQWKSTMHPDAAWASRYGSDFELAMQFLARSAEEDGREQAERALERRRKLRRTQAAVLVLAVLLLITSLFAYVALRERNRAEANLQLARSAVDESLSAAGDLSARELPDVPELEAFRRKLLVKARAYYAKLSDEHTHSEALRRDVAISQLKLGDIERLLENPAQGAMEYQAAIRNFELLSAEFPGQRDYKQYLGYAHNWLGETWRLEFEKQPTEAQKQPIRNEYDSAVGIQQALADGYPHDVVLRQELARTLYNRGIFLYDAGDLASSASDLRSAIALLTPLADTAPLSGRPPGQELARTANNLANVLTEAGQAEEAAKYYRQAVTLEQQLLERDTGSREFSFELAVFSNNLAILEANQNDLQRARVDNERALSLLQGLSAPLHMYAAEKNKAEQLRDFLMEPSASFSNAPRARRARASIRTER